MVAAVTPIRVLMLSHYFEERGGGIELIAAAIAGGLASHGFETIWAASGSADHEKGQPGCRKVAMVASSVAEKALGIPYPLLHPSGWLTILRETARTDVVLVHDALYVSSIVGCLAARWRRKPLVVVQHVGLVPYQSVFLRALMQAANRFIAGPMLRHADRVIFMSELTKRYFGGLSLRQTPAMIFTGVDTEVFSPPVSSAEIVKSRRELGLPADTPIALFVGRFVEKKGLRVLEQLAHLRRDVVFAFGGMGELDPRRWGLPHVLVYSGLSGRALAQLYRASSLLVLPSTGEGFPLVVQEALACGLPIICGADTACADPHASGFLKGVEVDVADPDRTALLFSEEMTRVLAQEVTQAERAARFTYAKANYSWGTCAAACAGVLRELHSA
jgi:glycosyltransferase involved in cell wall biosynthesis